MKTFSLKSGLAIGIPVAGLAVSTANYQTNRKKRFENKELQEKQLKALEKLTNSLNRVDKALSKLPEDDGRRFVSKKRGGLFRLFQKNNSYTSDWAYKGGILGGGIASGANMFLPKRIGSKLVGGKKDKDGNIHLEYVNDPRYKHPKFRKKYNKAMDSGFGQLLVSLGGVAIGATLGAIAGAIMDWSKAKDRKTTVNQRLMRGVLEFFRRAGYIEGQDFVRDPKRANLMKTKVCLVISRSADSLRLLINTINDPKLKKLSSEIVKNLPAMTTVTEKASDRFNELNITTMTTNNGDAVWVGSVAERFITAGYPVYLVEVG